MTNSISVKAVAPIRICDIGGWTDTWFAREGKIFNIAVYPFVEVQIHTEERSDAQRITLFAENYGDEISVDPAASDFGKHPLLEAAFQVMELPEDLALRVNIFSYAPPGASTGTSAAVSVALIGALDRLTRGRLTAHEVATMAQRLETDKLGLECGIQDQLASAYGGVNFIEMHRYPFASVSSVSLSNSTWWELEHRLVVVYIGKPHNSSEIHRKVIAGLGDAPHDHPCMEELRKLAFRAKDALFQGEFENLGAVMNENTEVQKQLHPELVCNSFLEIISIARDFKALGCKVNGAGGDGGSLTILTNGDMQTRRKLIGAIERKGFKTLPIYLARQGLRVW